MTGGIRLGVVLLLMRTTGSGLFVEQWTYNKTGSYGPHTVVVSIFVVFVGSTLNNEEMEKRKKKKSWNGERKVIKKKKSKKREKNIKFWIWMMFF